MGGNLGTTDTKKSAYYPLSQVNMLLKCWRYYILWAILLSMFISSPQTHYQLLKVIMVLIFSMGPYEE